MEDTKNGVIELENLFEFSGKFYCIKRQRFEIREIFMERVWYFLNSLDKSDLSFEELERESFVWSNKNRLGCEY